MSKLILLVEDNRSDEKLTMRAFKKSGFSNVLVAHDGREALDYLLPADTRDAWPPTVLPAVILLDLKLPRIDGLEVLRRVRADVRTRFVPVVVLTASREEEDILRSYSLGANAYVRKPLDFREFGEMAKAMGFFWLSMNESASVGRVSG
jgi:two-component system, response regulator